MKNCLTGALLCLLFACQSNSYGLTQEQIDEVDGSMAALAEYERQLLEEEALRQRQQEYLDAVRNL